MATTVVVVDPLATATVASGVVDPLLSSPAGSVVAKAAVEDAVIAAGLVEVAAIATAPSPADAAAISSVMTAVAAAASTSPEAAAMGVVVEPVAVAAAAVVVAAFAAATQAAAFPDVVVSLTDEETTPASTPTCFSSVANTGLMLASSSAPTLYDENRENGLGLTLMMTLDDDRKSNFKPKTTTAETLREDQEMFKKQGEEESKQEQPLLSLLRRHPVRVPSSCHLDPVELRRLLDDIDSFFRACDLDNCTNPSYAPGFWTRDDVTCDENRIHNHSDRTSTAKFEWVRDTAANALPYQFWKMAKTQYDSSDDGILPARDQLPAPSVACARRCYEMARRVVQLRLEHVEKMRQNQETATCSCIGAWDHVDGNVMVQLINQAVEQLMCQEAGEVLQTRLGSDAALDAWNASYCAPASNRLTTPLEYFFGTPIQLIASRDMYIGALVEAAVAAQSKIQIATCYVFWDDPAHRYVLMDLLPHLVRTKGVKVQLLLDLLVVESFTLRSALTFPAAAPFTTKIAAERAQKWATSFVQHLPSEGIRPPVSDRQYESPFHFLQSLLDVSRENADLFQVQFWCARDSREHYRIKSHVKCAVFDRQVALIGGSNVTPTVKSAFADLDALLAGKAASAIGDSFDTLWNAMSRQQHSSEPPAKVETEAGMSNPDLAEMVRRREWQDPGASVAILRSSPSSGGEDAILRVVLDKIRTARSEVVVCMGHSSYCRAFAKAVEEAASLRGVRVRILVNSLYSNDLRNGQADLFVSLRDLLAVAPSVEVYATTLPHFRDPSLDCNLPRPDFIHAKYVVVDREWSATGSWNLWTRSAFYEIEHEAFIQSPTIAGLLSDKFERDRLAHSIRVSAKDCTPGGPFCPRGCILCEGFGPFFKNRRNAVAL